MPSSTFVSGRAPIITNIAQAEGYERSKADGIIDVGGQANVTRSTAMQTAL